MLIKGITIISTSQFVDSARTALKIAFHQLNLQRGSRILVPDFICDVLIHPIQQVGLIPVYYPVASNLTPDWNVLETIVTNASCHALVMVHYFGQPQKIEQFRAFCSRHNLLLIEDNAHGYSGCFEGKLLGLFGDIGISSPRKIMGTPSGGVLYGANTTSVGVIQDMKSFPLFRPLSVIKTALRCSRSVWRFVKAWSDRNKNWSNARLHQESIQPNYGIDEFSRRRIISANWSAIASRRRQNWSAWAGFARSKGLQPIFSEVHPSSCPWGMPVYAGDLAERNSWLAWGTKNRVALFPWPTLPEGVINLGGVALDRWRKLICFPLDTAPEELKLQN